MHPFIIWTEPRSVGTALSAALAGISTYPTVEDDPFMYGTNAGPLNHIYEQWCRDGDPAAIYRALSRRIVFKHVPETFDQNFNADLTRAAEHNGYRHIRLVRLNVFAQLVSRGVAEQLDAWRRDATQRKAMRQHALSPLDAEDLILKFELGRARWDQVSQHLTSCLTLRSENIASPIQERRHMTIRRLLRFLEISPSALAAIDRRISRGRDTESLWPLVPNLGELSAALISRGIS